MSNEIKVMNGELRERANRSGLSSLSFCEASPISIYQNGIESSTDRYERLGIGNYNYEADMSNYEGIKDGIVSVSYSTILKWVGIALAVGLVIWVLVYYYKKMK